VVDYRHVLEHASGSMTVSYSALLGKRVEAHYRASDLHLSAVGTLISDSGDSIVLEEHFSQNGRDKTIRVEIPYEYVIRVVEAAENFAALPPQRTLSK
jgi:hypothetical protein